MELKKQWIEQGFINEPAPEGTDLKAEIRRMCEEKMPLSWLTTIRTERYRTVLISLVTRWLWPARRLKRMRKSL